MIVIPAVDIKAGRCVRLYQGIKEAETVYADDPAAMALRWQSEGADLVHVVDLDGAFDQHPANLPVIQNILHTLDIPIQVGGGIRTMETIRMYLEAGVGRVIIGTEAIRNPNLVKEACQKFEGRIIVGIDARNGYVAVDGWTRTVPVRAVELARRFEDVGVSAINFTDICRDGTQTGPNLQEIRRLAEAVSIPVIASGGVSCLADIEHLMDLEPFGVAGVITGKALYTGTLNLGQALSLIHSRRAGAPGDELPAGGARAPNDPREGVDS